MMQEGFTQRMGRRLAKVREDSGLKQVPFAEALDISQSAYNTYERGQREIPVRVLHALYSKFNVNAAWMMTGQGNAYNRDDKDLFHDVSDSVDRYLQKENCSVEPEKRRKLIDFLIDNARQHGGFTDEMTEKYLRSAI
jgi:transcriptional regulator with XRE-family HTH domain